MNRLKTPQEKALYSGRRPATTGRRPYPLRDGYKTTGPLFKAMASKTFKCKTKEEWRALMAERLEEVFNNADLSYWIFAHNEIYFPIPSSLRQGQILQYH